MAASFATYASQFIQRQPQNGQQSIASSSQPMFFSFTTDSGGGSRGHPPGNDFNDLDDPHLRQSGTSRQGDDDEDPYLHLDDDNSPIYDSRPLLASERPESPQGWLANQRGSSRYSRSPSPTPSDSTDSGPPPELYVGRPAQQKQKYHNPPLPPPTANRDPVSLSLTESLLPRDGTTRPLDVFSLPDPRHVPRRRRKYNDSIWTAVWCTGLSISLFFSILLPFITRKSPNSKGHLPYTTLLHTVPLITILTFVSAAVAYAHVFLLQIFVRPVMIATSVFIPATLFISALWAFIGSFMWERGVEPTWGETVGLRLFALIPLGLSLLTARRLLNLPRDIHKTSATLTLTTELLLANPLLLALSPSILLVMLLASIPFVTVIFRLLLIGYWQPFDSSSSSSLEWHVRGWANWAIAATFAIWLWTWGVARGTLRMTCASVIASWYFADPDAMPPQPMSTHIIHAALTRSSGPSLGTTVLSALILTAIRLLTLFTLFLERLPIYLPARGLFMVNGIRMLVGYLDSITTALSKYALVYVGLTGAPFMPGARRAQALTSKIGKKGFSAEPPLTLLTVAPLTLSFPFALSTYLFVAHTLGAPGEALGASLLAGVVTALVGLFCVGLVKDTADTLYMCYCVDKDVGERRREQVFSAFEYKGQPNSGMRGQTSPLSPMSPDQDELASPGYGQEQRQRAQVPPTTSPAQAGPSRTPAAPTQPLREASQRAPPPPPQQLEEDDIDPFEHSLSYLEDDGRFGNVETPTNATPPLTTAGLTNPKTSPIHHSRSNSYTNPKAALSHSRANSSTNAGLITGQNASEIRILPPVVSKVPAAAPSQSVTKPTVEDLSDSDDDGDGSQFYPGSGLF